MEAGLRKLLKLKDWVTVSDAARHLSISCDVAVSEADVLRFALDGRLTLSVYFVNKTCTRCANICSRTDSSVGQILPKTKNEVVRVTSHGVQHSDDSVTEYGGGIKFIGGLWDLAMIEGGRTAVEAKYQRLTGGPAVHDPFFEDLLLNRPDGTWAQLFEPLQERDDQLPYGHPKNYLSVGVLPSDCIFVVRTSALQELESAMSPADNALDRPVGQRERTTFLVIIAALAELARLKVDRPSAAAAAIEGQAARLGINVGLRTIEEKLKLLPEILRSRTDT
jgi:hypothetical protein